MSIHKELSVKSRVRGDFHARFCERVRVQLPRSTRPMILELEHKGRALFKSFLDQVGATGQPTKDSYDRVDYYFQIKGKKYVAEIKVRNAFYDDYLIEEDKL